MIKRKIGHTSIVKETEPKMRIFLNSERIRRVLARKNKDLSWLAKRMDISNTYLSMLLSGRKCPRPDKREKLQQALGQGLSWDELFIFEGGEEDEG